jgi:hypothetical protein
VLVQITRTSKSHVTDLVLVTCNTLTCNSTLTILTYELKEPFLSFDALGYNATLNAEARPAEIANIASSTNRPFSSKRNCITLQAKAGWLVIHALTSSQGVNNCLLILQQDIRPGGRKYVACRFDSNVCRAGGSSTPPSDEAP